MNNLANNNTFTDARDGQSYKIVKIGTQIWMGENLRYAAKNGCWCYENDRQACSVFGRLYDWQTARVACPSGWHLPSLDELTTLIRFLGDRPGRKLKSTWGWDSGNGVDTYGFNALPGGSRNLIGLFGSVGSFGSWWSSSRVGDAIWYLGLNYSDGVNKGTYDKSMGISVRCIRDL